MESPSKEDIRRSVRSLWRTCFGDTEGFMGLYFSKKYTHESNFCIWHDGRAVSALQALPYSIHTLTEDIPIAYMSGISTLPEERGKGYAGHLIRETHRTLYEKGVVMTMLIPAEKTLFDYYTRMGYGTVAFQHRRPLKSEIKKQCLSFHVEKVNTISDGIYASFDSLFKKNPQWTVLHSRSDMEVVLEDWHNSGGEIFVFCDQSSPVGFVCLRPDDETGDMLVYGSFLFGKVSEGIIYSFLKQKYSSKNFFIVDCIKEDINPTPYAQVRILHPEKILSICSSFVSSSKQVILLTDDEFPENTGCYSLLNGKKLGGILNPHMSFTPQGLAEWLFREHSISVLFMLD